MAAPADLTVVVLSWNTRDLTLRALRAVPAACAPFAVRTICVDNASADGTADAVAEACPDVRLLRNATNLGFARGNAVALAHLEGRAVVFLNSDTEARPGALAHVLRYLDAHPAVGVASPPLVGADGRPQRAVWGYPTAASLLYQYTPLGWVHVGRRASRRQRDDGFAATTGPVEALAGAAMVVRRDLCERLGGFDPGYPFYVEDVDLCWRAARAGAEVHYVADGPAVVHHGGASASIAGGDARLPLLQGILRLQRKRMRPGAYAAFALAFKVGVVTRSLWEIVRTPVAAAARAARGRTARAARTLETAGARVRFLERDLRAFLRA